jgi:ketosteroid isomerase-like protein
MTLDEGVEEFRSAANACAQGNPEPVRSLFSRAEDVTLANPFGPAVRGWENVSSALGYASSRFSDGEVTDFKNVASYVASDLATFLDTEHWRARVGGGDVTDFDLRVTSTYRNERGDWKIVHRHADPISSADPHGPLRATS